MDIQILNAPVQGASLKVASSDRIHFITEKLVQTAGVNRGENKIWVVEDEHGKELFSYFAYPNKVILHVQDIPIGVLLPDSDNVVLKEYASVEDRMWVVQPKLSDTSATSYIKEYALCQLGSGQTKEKASKAEKAVMILYVISFILLILFLFFGVKEMVSYEQAYSAPLYSLVLIRGAEFLVPGVICFVIGKVIEQKKIKNKTTLKSDKKEVR
ncbi:MAG TPA: hypothetical protein DEP00_01655 [Lachnospiraceae bacterium]|nr:hypothetical protein [Lachnospiraceae bacterium]